MDLRSSWKRSIFSRARSPMVSSGRAVLLEGACSAVAHGFPVRACLGSYSWIAETATLIPFAAHGLTPTEHFGVAVCGPCDRLQRSGRALAGAQPSSSAPGREGPRPAATTRFGLGSFVIVPLVSEGRCLGFLTCDERGELSLDAAEVDFSRRSAH